MSEFQTINRAEPWEINYAAKAFNVSPGTILDAIDAVGNKREDVEAWLIKTAHARYNLSAAEVDGRSSGRVASAENLILTLPADNMFRNAWLFNFGQSEEAQQLRAERGVGWNPLTKAATILD